MGIINGMKEQLAWGNLKYLGGYPGKVIPFICALHKEGNNITLYGGATWKAIFSIPKDDILNIRIEKGINKRENRIIMPIKYKETGLELSFSAGNLQLAYNKMVSEIHREDVGPVILDNEIKDLVSSDRINNTEKPKFYQKKGFKIAATFVVLIFMFKACSGSSNNTTSTNSSNAKQVEQKQEVKQEETKPAQTQEQPKDESIKEGMYKIGTDLSDGEYVIISDNTSTGYMQISKDSSGSFNSIIGNENIETRTLVTVNTGEYLDIKRAKMYPIDKAPKVTPQDNKLPEGMYKVGIDIQPGEYKVTSTGDGYVEVTTNSRHTSNGIVTNDNFNGDKYITVSNGQYLKLSRATLILH